jgi:TPR repeat protein
MAHFVRCIEGHVFDAQASPQCPTCGAIVDTPRPLTPSSTASPPPGPGVDHPIAAAAETRDETRSTPGIGARLARSAIRIVVVGSIVGVVGGVFVSVVLPSLGWSPLSRLLSSLPAASELFNSGAPTQTASAPAVAKIGIADTVQAALDVSRMTTLHLQHQYQEAATLAQKLAGQNNPTGFFTLGRLAMAGELNGKNLPEARKQFTASAKLGDPEAAVLAARMMEQGIGGPQDVESAKPLYLFASRSGRLEADGDLARLNIADQRGMTVREADNNLIAGNDIEASWKRMNELVAARSIPALCLAAWLYGIGTATPRDLQHAVELFTAGAADNNPSCVLGLSQIAASGLPTVQKNLVDADVLLHLAAAVGNKDMNLSNEIAKLEGQMSDDEKAEAGTILQSGHLPADRSALR